MRPALGPMLHTISVPGLAKADTCGSCPRLARSSMCSVVLDLPDWALQAPDLACKVGVPATDPILASPRGQMMWFHEADSGHRPYL